jgi:hypothetical protein
MRIAMWSGPRNLSTALMYSFGARPDCAVTDEPFYATYLRRTGQQHPMTKEILAADTLTPAEIVDALTGPIPQGRTVYYQKLMTHHMLPGMPLDWMTQVRNVFLIRHPARVIASYTAKREDPTAEEIGFGAQLRLFEKACDLGQDPLVIDAMDIRAQPEAALRALCAALGLPFDDNMLKWPAGGHPADGVWAKHWYGAVHRSTGFADPEGPLPELTGRHAALCETAVPIYERLRTARIIP